MQPQQQQSSRIDLVELKSHIVKKIGTERSRKYFYNLQRFLSLKLSKSELDKSCFHLLGRENLPLHNQLIRSILKNSFLAKSPPPAQEAGPAKSAIQKIPPARVVGHEQSGFAVLPQNHNIPIWSNGVLPPSPKRGRSGTRERKLRDRPSPLGPIGKVECHQPAGADDSSFKLIAENGESAPYDYQRPGNSLQAVAEQPQSEKDGFFRQSLQLHGLHSKDQAALAEDDEDVEQSEHLVFHRGSLVAPLGIPFCSASAGGAHRAPPVAGIGNLSSCCDNGGLSDTETLRKRMEQIAAAQGLGGVSLECANMLNNMLDLYLKRLIRSCVDLVGMRSSQDLRRQHIYKQQTQGMIMNGMWPSNHMHVQPAGGLSEVIQEKRPPCSISVLDFKVAMELNPRQLGEDWQLLLERIYMNAFED